MERRNRKNRNSRKSGERIGLLAEIELREAKVRGGVQPFEGFGPRFKCLEEGIEGNTVVDGRVAAQFFSPTPNQGPRTPQVTAPEVVEGAGDLDDALVEGLFCRSLGKPDFLKQLMTLEEIPTIESLDTPAQEILSSLLVHDRVQRCVEAIIPGHWSLVAVDRSRFSRGIHIAGTHISYN